MGRHEILATWLALTILFVYWFLGVALQICKLALPRRESKRQALRKNEAIKQPRAPHLQKITEGDLGTLVRQLDGGDARENENPWEFVLDKSSQGVSYCAKRREPKNGGPTQYLSTTVFQKCSPELLRDFYMDNEFRLQWDKTVVAHKQLDICLQTGTEIGQTIKKFPLMTAREYVLAWRLWEGEKKTFYCIIKACEHDLAPKQQKYMRVEEYFSAWRIRQVPGTNGCEVKMFHSENIGMRREMAKMAFSRGIWSYICKMESNLRRYAPPQPGSGPNAVTLCHKAPLELFKDACSLQEKNRDQASQGLARVESTAAAPANGKDSSRPISLFAQSVFLLGWAVFLGHGGTSLGGKLAAAVFMNKAVRRRQRSPRSSSSRYVPRSFSINQAASAAAAAAATAATRRQARLD